MLNTQCIFRALSLKKSITNDNWNHERDCFTFLHLKHFKEILLIVAYEMKPELSNILYARMMWERIMVFCGCMFWIINNNIMFDYIVQQYEASQWVYNHQKSKTCGKREKANEKKSIQQFKENMNGTKL